MKDDVAAAPDEGAEPTDSLHTYPKANSKIFAKDLLSFAT